MGDLWENVFFFFFFWGGGGGLGEGLEGANRKKIVGKSQKSGKNRKIIFLLEMVLKALGTPRNPFKS